MLAAQSDPILHMEQHKPWNRAFLSAAMKEDGIIVAKQVRRVVCHRHFSSPLSSSIRAEQRGKGKASYYEIIGRQWKQRGRPSYCRIVIAS